MQAGSRSGNGKQRAKQLTNRQTNCLDIDAPPPRPHLQLLCRTTTLHAGRKEWTKRDGGKGDNKQLGAPQSRGLLSYFTLPWAAAVTEREERRNQCIILAAQQQKQKAEKKICIHCALCSKPRQKTKKATTQRAVRTCVGLGHMQALPIFGLPRGCNVDNVDDNDDNNNSMRKESSSWLAAQNRIRIYKQCRPLFLAYLGSTIIECLNVIAL